MADVETNDKHLRASDLNSRPAVVSPCHAVFSIRLHSLKLQTDKKRLLQPEDLHVQHKGLTVKEPNTNSRPRSTKVHQQSAGAEQACKAIALCCNSASFCENQACKNSYTSMVASETEVCATTQPWFARIIPSRLLLIHEQTACKDSTGIGPNECR